MRLACHVIHCEEANENCFLEIACLVRCQEVVIETVASASSLLYIYRSHRPLDTSVPFRLPVSSGVEKALINVSNLTLNWRKKYHNIART